MWARTLRLSAVKLSEFLTSLNHHFQEHIGHPLFFEPKHVLPGEFFNLSPDEQQCDVASNIEAFLAGSFASAHPG